MTETNGSEETTFVVFELRTREPHYVGPLLLRFLLEELGTTIVRYTSQEGHIGCVVNTGDSAQSWQDAERIIAAIGDYPHLRTEVSAINPATILFLQGQQAFIEWFVKFEDQFFLE